MVLYNTFQTNTPVASTNVLDGAEAARLRQANLDAYLAATATVPRPMPQTGTGVPPVVTDFDKAGTEAGTRMNSAIDQGVANARMVGSWGAGNQDAINQQVNAVMAQQYGEMAGLGQRAMGDTTDGSVANELAYQQQALANIGRSGNIFSDQMKQLSNFNAQSAEQAMNSSRRYNSSAIEDQMNAGKRAAADAAAAAARANANEKDPFSVANMRAMKYLLEQKAGKVDPTDWLLQHYRQRNDRTTGEDAKRFKALNEIQRSLRDMGISRKVLEDPRELKRLKTKFGGKWTYQDFDGKDGGKLQAKDGKLYVRATGKVATEKDRLKFPQGMRMMNQYIKVRDKYIATPDITDQQVRDAIQAQIDMGY